MFGVGIGLDGDDGGGGLGEAAGNAAFSLFCGVGVPGEVEVNEGFGVVEVDATVCDIGTDEDVVGGGELMVLECSEEV